MGGNIFKKDDGSSLTSRLNLEEYNQVVKYIIDKLKHRKCEATIPLQGKTDFGDIDILVFINEKEDIYNLIKDTFEKIYIHKNGKVISIALQFLDKRFQIDFIGIYSEDTFENYRTILAFGGAGLIIGKMCKKYGITYGEDGLFINLRENTFNNNVPFNSEHIEKIYLSNNVHQIFSYLGVDFRKFMNAKTIEENYDLIIKSKYYDREIFMSVSHEAEFKTHREELKYLRFLKYINIDPEMLIKNQKFSNIKNLQYKFLEDFGKLDDAKKIYNEFLLNKERKLKYNRKYIIDEYAKNNIDIIKSGQVNDISTKIESKLAENFSSFNVYLDNHTKEKILEDIHNIVSREHTCNHSDIDPLRSMLDPLNIYKNFDTYTLLDIMENQ